MSRKEIFLSVVGLGIFLYSTFVRFANPELSETQLFLKMIGF